MCGPLLDQLLDNDPSSVSAAAANFDISSNADLMLAASGLLDVSPNHMQQTSSSMANCTSGNSVKNRMLHSPTGRSNSGGIGASLAAGILGCSLSSSSGLSPSGSQLLPQNVIRFVCPVCCKGFRSKVDLERHVRTHTGEKPFQCQYCMHRSATKGNLKAHIRHIHSDKLTKPTWSVKL